MAIHTCALSGYWSGELANTESGNHVDIVLSHLLTESSVPTHFMNGLSGIDVHCRRKKCS